MQLNNKNRDVKAAFYTIICGNDSQKELVGVLIEVFKRNVSREGLLKSWKKE